MEATLMSINRGMDLKKKMWYIYTIEYYSAIIKEWNNFICSNLDGSRDCHTEWSKSEKDKHHDITNTWSIFLKMFQMNLFTEQK